MFPFQPNADLFFGASTTSEAYQIDDDLISNDASMESNLISFGNDDWQRSTEVVSFKPASQRQRESKKELDERKVMHREVEKKRRQEMSTLHASLASLLPLSKMKGKRSVGDQIGEAVNHIKQMEKKIEKLKIRRDELKMKSFSSSDPNFTSLNSNDGFVTVNMAEDGMEILVSTKKESSDLGLSRVLAVLVERQLDVVTCVSTIAKDRFLHKIKVETTDMRNVDVSELQDRLTGAIK